MARIKYYYDTEKCEFQPAKSDAKTIARTAFQYTLIGSLIAFAVLVGVFSLHSTPREKMYMEDNARLRQQVEEYDQQIHQLQAGLDDLHQKDNSFYRAIMNLPEVSTGMWNGGIGGAADDPTISPEAMDELDEQLEKMDIQQKVQSASYANLFKKLQEKEEEMLHIPSIRPVTGSLVSGFGMRMHPILKIKKLHTGLDFACTTGTPIYATGDGVIGFAGRNKNGYGIHVDINHGYGYVTKYAHLSELKVKKGEKVKRGDLIGLSGSTGLSKGPHLHYEILKNGRKINPIDFFYSDLAPEEYVKFKKQAEMANESMD